MKRIIIFSMVLLVFVNLISTSGEEDRIWPSDASVEECRDSHGRVHPATGEDSATWFHYGGCGSWKVFDVSPGSKIRIESHGDSCSSCVLWHINYYLDDYYDGEWHQVAYIDGPDYRGCRHNYSYTPKGEKIRIRATSGFYVAVYEELLDLEISSEDISFSNPNPSEGEPIIINATIHNTGEENASDIVVDFHLGNPGWFGRKIAHRKIPLLEANSSETISVEWNATKSGDIYVVVDPEDEISESDEDNNEAFKRLNIEGPDYLLYFAIGVIIVTCILGVIVLFAIYRALTYKKPAKENVECPRCGMILPMGTRECPVCGGEIK